MILTRTPFRISFFGGGTDYPSYYKEHGGAVLGATIDKYVYVGYHQGVTGSWLDLPTKSGLGTSSARTVGRLRAVSNLSQRDLAVFATEMEQDIYNVGSQDQYLCAMGGFRHLRFDEHGVRDRLIFGVEPLQDYLMLFDTHQYRISGDIIEHQLAEMNEHLPELGYIKQLVDEGLGDIKAQNWPHFGVLLHEAWRVKQKLAKEISTDAINIIYDEAIEAGAVGGKLLGAGGGGFILFLVEPEKQESVRDALADLTHVPFRFENEGTRVIYRD